VDTISLATLCDDAGTVEFTASSYACSDTSTLEVVDCGLDTNELVIETVLISVSSPSEPGGESVLLTETGPGTARFVGTLFLGAGGAGVLSIAAGETITATYVDADDGLGGVNVVVTANAVIDCTAPALSNVAVSGIAPIGATIGFVADEPVTGTVLYGTFCGSLISSESASGASTSPSIELTGLDDETTYYFAVRGEDVAGNVTVDDNGGACYSFTTLPAQDYFTEEFTGDNDLDNTTLSFTPAGGQDYYAFCGDGITGLPTMAWMIQPNQLRRYPA
jgi:hypothetical protein